MRLKSSMFVPAAVAACAALSLPATAAAADRDVRRAGSCTASSRVEIRLKADDGRIRLELEIEARKPGVAWNVILLRERRIAFRGVVRARSGSREARLRRTFDDWFGRDLFVIRASGPQAEMCRVSVAI